MRLTCTSITLPRGRVRVTVCKARPPRHPLLIPLRCCRHLQGGEDGVRKMVCKPNPSHKISPLIHASLSLLKMEINLHITFPFRQKTHLHIHHPSKSTWTAHTCASAWDPLTAFEANAWSKGDFWLVPFSLIRCWWEPESSFSPLIIGLKAEEILENSGDSRTPKTWKGVCMEKIKTPENRKVLAQNPNPQSITHTQTMIPKAQKHLPTLPYKLCKSFSSVLHSSSFKYTYS